MPEPIHTLGQNTEITENASGETIIRNTNTGTSIRLATFIDLGRSKTNAITNDDYNESVPTSATASGTTDIDLSTGNHHVIEAVGNVTITFSNISSTPPGNSLLLTFEDDDGLGPYTITWPGSVTWPGGSVEDTIPASGDIRISLTTTDGGTTWRAIRSGRDFA